MYNRDDLLAFLIRDLKSQVCRSTISSIAKERYLYLDISDGTTLDLVYCRVTVGAGVGIAFSETASGPEIDKAWLGRCVPDVYSELPVELRVACVDALYGMVDSVPCYQLVARGNCHRRALARAKIIVDEARRMAVKNRVNVVLVGAVGTIASALKASTFVNELEILDFSPAAVGQTMSGSVVESGHGRSYGSETLERIGRSDIAVVTGMALVNDTLYTIVGEAAKAGTKVIVFSQTGSHFAKALVDNGVDCAISESYPFYTVPGVESRYLVYRRS